MNKRCLEDNPSPAAKPHVFLIIHQKQMSYQEFISELSDSVAMLGYTWTRCRLWKREVCLFSIFLDKFRMFPLRSKERKSMTASDCSGL